MNVPVEILLRPELLSNEQLLFIIQERRIQIPDIQRMPRDGLLEVFRHYCVPNEQREYSDSRRGKVPINRSPLLNVDSQPSMTPWHQISFEPPVLNRSRVMEAESQPSMKPWNQINFEPPKTYNKNGYPDLLKNTEGIPPMEDYSNNISDEGEDLQKSPTSEQSGSGTRGIYRYKSYADRKKARQQRRKLAKARVRESNAKGTPHNINRRLPTKLKHQETYSQEPSRHLPVKHPKFGQEDDSARSSAKRSSELAVAVTRRDGELVDEALSAIIRNRILANMERAMEQDEDDRKLAFATSGLVSEGYFLITPENEEARDWLLSCDLGEFQGVPIVARRLYRARVMVWLPGRDKMPTDILKWLQRQNKGRVELLPNEWTLITKEVLPTGVRLVIGVPSEAEEAWGATQMLHFQLTKVTAKLLGSVSKTPMNKQRVDTPWQTGA